MKKKLIVLVTLAIFSLGAHAQLDRSIVPTPQPNPEINITVPDATMTESGMKVIVVENHKLPMVSFQLYVNYPVIREGDKAGLGEIFGELLGSGTANNSKDEFDAKVDYMGASISTNARGFFASSLKKHTPKLLELLSEVIVAPSFPQDEFDRIIKQTVSGIESQKSDPSSMASNVASIVNYGKEHPYGEIMTEETLANCTLEDIRKHYEKYFIPNMAYLIIVGDVTREEANAYVQKYFSNWKKGSEMKQERFEVPTYSGNNVFFVNKPGAVQSRINLTSTVDLNPAHSDVVKLKLLNQILGGPSFSSHLMKNLREDKAYTYGCYSQISSDQLIGNFSAGGSFRNEVTDSAVVQILKEIEWMGNNLVGEDELGLAKNSMTGSFARSLERPETMARFALNTIMYNLPKDYYTTYLTRLEKITKEELLETAKKYLRGKNLNIVVVGNKEVASKLKIFDSNGKMEFKDSYGNEQIQMKAVQPGVTPESIFKKYAYKRFSVSNQKDFDKAMKKVGFIQMTYSVYMEAFGAEMFMTSYQGVPNKTATIVKIKSAQGNMVAQKEWFNGEAGGTFVAMRGKTKYEGDELEDKKTSSFPMEQMHYLSNPKLKVELVGIDEVEGKEYYKIKISKAGKEDFSFEYYSLETGWLEMEQTFTSDEDGNVVESIITYSDYKEIKKGFMVAHKMTIVNNGQTLACSLSNTAIKKKPKSSAFEGQF